jgi:hypothetical protein
MRSFAEEIRAFRTEKAAEVRDAAQLAAFRIATGIDLSEALRASGAERQLVVDRLKRLIERERLKGANRHWSYDLNRHIALKQALDRLAGSHERPSVRVKDPSKKKRRRMAPL